MRTFITREGQRQHIVKNETTTHMADDRDLVHVYSYCGKRYLRPHVIMGSSTDLSLCHDCCKLAYEEST
jgi:hypothetical protein